MDLGLEFQETNVGIKIKHHVIFCVPIFRQNGKLGPNLPKNGISNIFVTLMVLQRARWRLKLAECRWIELGGGRGGVHGLVIPHDIFINMHSNFQIS